MQCINKLYLLTNEYWKCSTIDLSALCNSSNSIWKTIESHRWVKLSCENIGVCLSYVPFTLVIRLINCWDFIQIWFDNKMLSSQWDNDYQHFVYIIFSWYLLGIITRQGFLFSCSWMNRCTCLYAYTILLSTLTSVASDLFNYSLRLDNELSTRPSRGRHGLWTGLKTQMGCLQIVWWNQQF